MDPKRTIDELRREGERLDRVITSLEKLQDAATLVPPQKSRRGRKFLSEKERREISERMKKSWAARRANRQMWRSLDVHGGE